VAKEEVDMRMELENAKKRLMVRENSGRVVGKTNVCS
jgi:hypothetical protein